MSFPRRPDLPAMAFNAEVAYLFAHVALREAAYQLWLPSDRARLHLIALELLEALPESQHQRIAYEMAGHAHAAQQGTDEQRDAEVLAQLRAKEVLHLRAALSDANKRYQNQRVIEVCRRLIASPAAGAEVAADAHHNLAKELHDIGRLDEALSHYTRCIELAEAGRLAGYVSRGLLGCGRIHSQRGNKAEAEKLYRRAIAAAEQGGDTHQQCNALNWLAGVFEDTERAHLSEGLFRHSMAVARAAGVQSSYLSALGNLANHMRHVGRVEEAVAMMREVLHGFEALGSDRDTSVALNNMGRTLFLLGRSDEADEVFSRALKLLAPMGQIFSLAFCLGNVAEVWLARGKPGEARDALQRAIAICDETAALMYGAAYKATLAGLEILTGRRERAQELIEESRSDFLHGGAEQYIPDYCDIVRLRIAADAACDSATLAGRKTAKINALVPRASWLPVMRQILEGMKKSLARQKAGALELKRSIEMGQALLEELEAAIRENRPARIYHGYRPEELSPDLKAALGLGA